MKPLPEPPWHGSRGPPPLLSWSSLPNPHLSILRPFLVHRDSPPESPPPPLLSASLTSFFKRPPSLLWLFRFVSHNAWEPYTQRVEPARSLFREHTHACTQTNVRHTKIHTTHHPHHHTASSRGHVATGAKCPLLLPSVIAPRLAHMFLRPGPLSSRFSVGLSLSSFLRVSPIPPPRAFISHPGPWVWVLPPRGV